MPLNRGSADARYAIRMEGKVIRVTVPAKTVNTLRVEQAVETARQFDKNGQGGSLPWPYVILERKTWIGETLTPRGTDHCTLMETVLPAP